MPFDIPPFATSRLPRIEFGAGCLARLPALAAGYGQSLLLVLGDRAFEASPHAAPLYAELTAQGCRWKTLHVAGEPTPALVDAAVHRWHGGDIELVIGIGGGSVLDAAKAIAGLLKPGNPVLDHLEGMGPELPYQGPATPFIAVPTTAGTGSEATRNAVLTRHGPDGFKKSFRDEQLIAEVALVDPDLLAGCPPALIAANGMDALTQLLEAYVSSRANPVSDALALAGLQAVRDGLLVWHAGGEEAAAGRARMAFAALLSGICLAQAGLGSVHGLAQPLGSLFPIPHGVACGTMLAAATRINIDVMQRREPEHPALARYARAGRLLSGEARGDDAAAHARLLHTLEAWTERLALPDLSTLGVDHADIPRIVALCRGSSMRTNPVVLTDDEVARILRARLD